MANEIIEAAKANMQKSAEALQRELGGIRAGRANAGLLNRVEVEYYGEDSKLNFVYLIEKN